MLNFNDIDPGRVKNIVVEGIECAGKTTLIDDFRRKSPGWDLKFLAHKDGDQFSRYRWEYDVNDGTVFNRGHFSEVVYSALHDRPTPFSDEQRQTLDKMLAEHAIVVFCDPSLDDVMDRYRARRVVQPIDFDQIETVHGLFRSTFEGVPHISYQSTDLAARDNFVGELEEALKV